MTIGSYLALGTSQLTAAGIQTARLDCLVLLGDVVGVNRAHLLAHDEQILTDQQVRTLDKHIAQRVRHMPLAYIRGIVEFYGRTFSVDTKTLVPRPETETVIEFLLSLTLPNQPIIADIGCGSGCIGITAALELPNAKVYLSDISEGALHIARKNARQLSAQVHIQKRDLLQQAPQHLDVIATNLPYVPITHPINQAASFEPQIALFSGEDGLDLYRTFWQQVKSLSHSPRYIMSEALPSQHPAMEKLALKSGYRLEQTSDFVQQFVQLGGSIAT